MSDDDGAGDENLYLKAIHHPEREGQLIAMSQFLLQESDQQHRRLNEIEADEGGIPEGAAAQWNYEKGKLDMARTMHGLVAQACLAQDVFEMPDDPSGNSEMGPEP